MTEKLQNVALIYIELPDCDSTADIQELERLVDSAKGKVVLTVTQKRAFADPYTMVGSGKIDEIKATLELYEATNDAVDVIIFSEPLNPTQRKTIGDCLDRQVLDRIDLILDIFALRATTAEGKKQVELAQLQYNLITKPDKGFSRQGGGIGTRGPGETKLETNKRLIRDRIHRLKQELDDIAKRRSVTRKKRTENEIFTVGLVGYTNAGKSTLFNLLTEAEVYADDKLFATLDTTVRKARINDTELLFCDTVGFVNKLPHQLIEAFKSTLEEAKYADLLLHVIDSTDPNAETHIAVTEDILAQLDVTAPIIRVYNKCDLSEQAPACQALANRPTVFCSAKTGKNIDVLKDMLAYQTDKVYAKLTLSVPFAQSGEVISALHACKASITPMENESCLQMQVKIKRRYIDKFIDYIVL